MVGSEAPMSTDCTNTTAEPQSTEEAASCSESHTSTLSVVSAGLEASTTTDCAQPNTTNSTAADAAKPRESSSASSASGEPVRQQTVSAGSEPLPAGYVGLILTLLLCFVLMCVQRNHSLIPCKGCQRWGYMI